MRISVRATGAGRAALALLSLALIAGCGGGGAAIVTPTCVVKTVAVLPSTATLAAGATQPLSASINATNCTPAPVASWSSSAVDVATVSSSGLVTAVTAGSAIITATASGASGTALITVTPPPVATVNVTMSNASLAIGATGTATAVALSSSSAVLSGRTVAWSSASPQIASVSQAGLVTAVAPGTVSIRATVEGVVGQIGVTVLPALAITTAVPADGSSTASIESVVRLTFSAAVNATTVTPTSVVLSRGGTTVPATLTVAANVVTVTPSALLTEFGTAYTVLVTTAVKTAAGQSLLSNGGVAFTTEFWDPNYQYRLTNQSSGPSKSLDTFSGGSNQCFMGDTGLFSGQFWYFIARGNGVYSMQNAFGGPTLGLEGADTGTACFLTSGGLPDQVTFSGMMWKPIAIAGIAGYYYLRPASTTTKSLSVVTTVPQMVVTPAAPTANSSSNWTFTRIGHR